MEPLVDRRRQYLRAERIYKYHAVDRCEADSLSLEARIRQHRKRVVKEERAWLKAEARRARSKRA